MGRLLGPYCVCMTILPPSVRRCRANIGSQPDNEAAVSVWLQGKKGWGASFLAGNAQTKGNRALEGRIHLGF
jgi:hypothetical protein